MHIAPFTIEQFFARYEFSSPHVLCASDCESISVEGLLTLADMSLAELGELRLGYTESQGHPELRRLVAAQYEGQVTADQVVMLGAPEEGIYLLMRALLAPGDHVVVLTPAYNSLLNVAEHICGNVSQWVIRQTDTGWWLDMNDLANLLTPKTRLLIMNFPHNPTGTLPSTEIFQAIVDLARQHGVWVFSDEMYRGLELNGRSPLPSAVTLYERAVSLAGLSKVQGLPGLRTGWLIMHDPALRENLLNWKHYTTICAAAPSEFLAIAALRAQRKLVARNRAILHKNLQVADAFFARWPDLFVWRRPLAGSVALVEVRLPDVTAYCHQLAAETGVLLLPGQYIGCPDQFVRWGFGRNSFAANLAYYEAHLRGETADDA